MASLSPAFFRPGFLRTPQRMPHSRPQLERAWPLPLRETRIGADHRDHLSIKGSWAKGTRLGCAYRDTGKRVVLERGIPAQPYESPLASTNRLPLAPRCSDVQ